MEENMKSSKKLAILGLSSNIYKTKLQEIIDRCGYVWSGWTYQLHENKKKVLDEQINNNNGGGFFHLYVHIAKDSSPKRRREGASRGSGLVEYRLIVKHFNYDKGKTFSPVPGCSVKNGVVNESITRHRLWAFVEKIEDIDKRNWNTFIDYDAGKYLRNFKWNIPHVYFGYIDDS